MTLIEFKAWFEGFIEGIDKTPTEKQWKKIQAKVKDIDGAPVTQKIFVDRYVPYPTFPYHYPPVWSSPTNPTYPYWTVYCGAVGVGGGGGGGGSQNVQSSFCSTTAMNQLGRYEARND